MTKHTIENFLELGKTYPVIDVRSEGEFAAGHIPGAVNIPLFNNDERAEIGTLYVQTGHDAAVKRGLDFVGPKMRALVEAAESCAVNKTVCLHCWRGGMRSESTAWLFEMSGLTVHLLTGGYKSYRRWCLEKFSEPRRIVILGGKTGSGKTHILQKLSDCGEQILDLEMLAHHKGSAFGALGEQPQPTQEQFENDLAFTLAQTDPVRRLWVEDESPYVGKCDIPNDFWSHMKKSFVVHVDVPLEVRIAELVSVYGTASADALADSVMKIKKKLGGQKCTEALEAIERADFSAAAALVLFYYDKTYQYQLDQRPAEQMVTLSIDAAGYDAADIAKKLAAMNV